MAEFIDNMQYEPAKPEYLKDIPTVVDDLMSIADKALRRDRYGYIVIRAIKEKTDKIYYTIKEVIRFPSYPQSSISNYILDFLKIKTNDDLYIYERINRLPDELTSPFSNYVESDRSQTIVVRDITNPVMARAKNYSYILEQLD